MWTARRTRNAFIVAIGIAAEGCASSARFVKQDEAIVVTDLRAVRKAEVEFSGANQGYYGTLRCLLEPWSCLNGYPGQPFISRSLAALEPEHGYKRQFFSGPLVFKCLPGAAGPGMPAAESITKWAYTAVPEGKGARGKRAFCADSTGKICVVREGFVLVVADGECMSPCDRIE